MLLSTKPIKKFQTSCIKILGKFSPKRVNFYMIWGRFCPPGYTHHIMIRRYLQNQLTNCYKEQSSSFHLMVIAFNSVEWLTRKLSYKITPSHIGIFRSRPSCVKWYMTLGRPGLGSKVGSPCDIYTLLCKKGKTHTELRYMQSGFVFVWG